MVNMLNRDDVRLFDWTRGLAVLHDGSEVPLGQFRGAKVTDVETGESVDWVASYDMVTHATVVYVAVDGKIQASPSGAPQRRLEGRELRVEPWRSS